MSTLTSGSHFDRIPSHILEQAIAWAVKLQSGTADAALRAAWKVWRAADPIHESAWQELQAVEQEFRTISPPFREPAFKALENVQRNRSLDRSRRKALKLLGLGAAGIALGWSATGRDSLRDWITGMGPEHVTVTGERRTVDLMDGTRLMLNTATAVDVKFTPEHRLIVLQQGEIFIRTGKDNRSPNGRRPFRVETAQGRFEAIGTRFLVRQEENRIRLRVEEGAAAMPADVSGQFAIAQSGQEFLIGLDSPVLVTDSRFEAAGWIDGVIVAKQMRLADFLEELSRYRAGWLQCDPRVADLRVSGVFQLDDTERALEALMHALPIALKRYTRYWVTIIPS